MRADEKRFGDAAALAEGKIKQLKEQLEKIGKENITLAENRGEVAGSLKMLSAKEKALQGFIASLGQESLSNLEKQIAEL